MNPDIEDMVVLVNGVALEEPPRDIPAFFRQYTHFKEQAANLCSNKTEVIGPVGLLYVFQREFAATHPHDNKISVIGTDDVTTGHILIIRHSGQTHFLSQPGCSTASSCETQQQFMTEQRTIRICNTCSL